MGEGRALETCPSPLPKENKTQNIKLQDVQVCSSLLKGNFPVLDLHCRAHWVLQHSSFLEEAKRDPLTKCAQAKQGCRGMSWLHHHNLDACLEGSCPHATPQSMVVKISLRAGTGLLCLLLQNIHHCLWDMAIQVLFSILTVTTVPSLCLESRSSVPCFCCLMPSWPSFSSQLALSPQGFERTVQMQNNKRLISSQLLFTRCLRYIQQDLPNLVEVLNFTAAHSDSMT